MDVAGATWWGRGVARREAVRAMTFRESDYGYAAGTIDSDGYIGITRTRRKRGYTAYIARVQVHQVDRQAVDLLSEMFGGKVLFRHAPSHLNRRPTWSWSRGGKSAVQVCDALLPYFRIKQAQALIVIKATMLAATTRKFLIPEVDPTEPMVSVRQAAEMVGLTIPGVYHAIYFGVAPVYRENGSVFIPESFIATWRGRGQSPKRRARTHVEMHRMYLQCRSLNKTGRRLEEVTP